MEKYIPSPITPVRRDSASPTLSIEEDFVDTKGTHEGQSPSSEKPVLTHRPTIEEIKKDDEQVEHLKRAVTLIVEDEHQEVQEIIANYLTSYRGDTELSLRELVQKSIVLIRDIKLTQEEKKKYEIGRAHV